MDVGKLFDGGGHALIIHANNNDVEMVVAD